MVRREGFEALKGVYINIPKGAIGSHQEGCPQGTSSIIAKTTINKQVAGMNELDIELVA